MLTALCPPEQQPGELRAPLGKAADVYPEECAQPAGCPAVPQGTGFPAGCPEALCLVHAVAASRGEGGGGGARGPGGGDPRP